MALWLVMSLFWVGVSARAYNMPGPMHNVRVLERYDDYSFKMAVENPRTHVWNEFGMSFCKTYKPTSEIQKGVTLTLLEYEENKIDFCMEIARHDLGYILLRGENNAPIIASFAGQTASRPSETNPTTSPTTD